MPCPCSHFATCVCAVPIFTLRTCSYSVPINTFGTRAPSIAVCSCLVCVPIIGTPAGPDKVVFMFCACVYYTNASGPRKGRVHFLCVCLLQERQWAQTKLQRAQTRPWYSCSVPVLVAATLAGLNKAVFMFGACACCSNASGPKQGRVHVWCVCLLQEHQRTETKPCSCSVHVPITATPVGPDKAVFMFDVCVYHRNASGPSGSR